MNYAPVLTKRDFVRRYESGEFGNASPTWNDPKSFWSSAGSSKYHLRNRVAGAKTYYDLDAASLYSLWKMQPDVGSWYASAMCPTDKTTFQGEVLQTEHSLSLVYTTVAKPMREALAEYSRYATGIIAVSLLRYYMNARSYDWLQTLLDRYPLHVVEFTCLSTCWGTLPGYNTLFWEVRSY